MTTTKFTIILAFITILLPGSSSAQFSLRGAAILPAHGQYFEFENPVDTGKGWLALQATNASWELVPAHLSSKRIVVRNLGQVEDMELKSDHPDALFLLRHPTLRTGKVETPELKSKDSSRRRPRDERVQILWHGQVFRLIEKGLNVTLVSANTKTKLGQLRAANNDEYYSSLLWAGDLDRDGSLDVIVEFSSYDTGEVCLYLSSAATQGNLVKKISCWSSGG